MDIYLWDSVNWQLHNAVSINTNIALRFYQLAWLRRNIAQTYAQIIPLFVMYIGIVIGVRGWGMGTATPSAWKISGKHCFQGKRKLLKNAER